MSEAVTKNNCPPIPIRSLDWSAWLDGREEVSGHGATEREAIQSLYERIRDGEESA